MNNKLLAFLFCGLLLGACALADPGAATSPGSQLVLVEVDGRKLTLADMEAQNPGALFSARNAFYQAERKALDKYIEAYLLQRQAEREKLTVEQLLDRHVNSAAGKVPSEEALHVYYDGLDTKRPYESVRDEIIQQIKDNRVAKARTAYVQSLYEGTSIRFTVDAPRAPIPLNDTPLRGPANAPVTLIEYSDYECPYCQKIAPALDKLVAAYGDRLVLAYKDMPLPMHSHAEKAAEAAHCAGEQGKYWEYHDVLFATKELEPAQLKAHARTLGLDPLKFDQCLDSGKEAARVQAQLDEAEKEYQLQGTPSLFINGRFFSGALTFEQLSAVVDEELGKR